MIKYDGIVTTKSNSNLTIRTVEKQKKREASLKNFRSKVGNDARESERRAVKSLEYARHTFVK